MTIACIILYLAIGAVIAIHTVRKEFSDSTDAADYAAAGWLILVGTLVWPVVLVLVLLGKAVTK